MPALVQQATPASAKGVSTLTAPAATLNVTNGNVLTFTVSIHGGQTVGVGQFSVGSGTATFGAQTKQVSLLNGTTLDSEIWTTTLTATGTLTVTVSLSASATSAVFSWEEWSALTETADGTSSANATAPGNVTTTNANDVILDCASENAAAQPTNPASPWISLTGANSTGGGGTSNCGQSCSYQIVSATGTFNPTFTSAGQVVQVALKAAVVVTASLPLPLYAHRHVHVRRVIVQRKRVVKTGIFLERIPQAPFPNFPEQIRRRQQPKRIPRIKSLRPHQSELNRVLIPPRPFPEFPVELRHRQQPKRISRVKPKRRVYGTLFDSPPPIPSQPLVGRRGLAQKKRIPRVKVKRRVYGTELLIPQAPAVVTGNLPLIFHGRQRRRLARSSPRTRRQQRLIPSPTVASSPILRTKLQKHRLLKPVRRGHPHGHLSLPPGLPTKAIVLRKIPSRTGLRRALKRAKAKGLPLIIIIGSGSIITVSTDAIVNWRERGGY